MTFFYNLNDKLNAIREKPETTHKQLNERNMSRAAKGYEKYGKEGMQALAKAGREGKALDPVRAKYDKYDKDQVNELSTDLLKRARDKAGMKYAQADDRRDQKASDKYNAQDDKFNSALRKKQKDMDEGMGDVAKRVGSAVKKVGGAVLNRLGHGSDEDMRKDLQRKMGMPQTGKKPEQVKEKMSPARAQSFAALAPPKDKITFADKIAGAKKEVDEMLGDVAAEAIKSALSPKQKQLDKNQNGKLDANDFAMLRGGKTSNGGTVTKTKTGMKHSAGPGRYGGSDEESHVVDRLKGPSTKNLTGKQVADEGWDEMEKDVKSRMGARKVGDVTHGDKHDTQEIPGGRRVTRRVDPNTGYSVGADSDEPAAGEKRGRGRPKGPAKAPERVTGRATKHKGGRKTNENDLDITDRGEYDQEGDMAKDSIKTVVRHAQALEKILGDNDNLPEWVQSKLAKIEGMMTAVDDYMQNQNDDEEMAVGEEKTSTRDNRAERAGKKVTKDIEYDEKKKDHIHGKKRGSEDAKAEKAGKKVAKDIEYDEKKKKVKEAGGTDTPTASSGFGFGQGIYDSMNRELETMIRESMNISMSMNTDANGGPSKSVTVTATDDDAVKLGELLKNAGLGGDYAMGDQAPGTEVEVHGAEGIADQIRQAIDGDHEHADGEVCDACGQEECGCEEVDEAYGDDAVSQNSPDFPSNIETNDDALQYSGGLNGPKSTGQTTIPVVASQDERQKGYGDGFDEDSLARLREMAGIRETKKDVEEEKTEEGNLFTGNLAKARADGKKEADLDGDGDMEKVKESIRDLTRRWNQFKG